MSLGSPLCSSPSLFFFPESIPNSPTATPWPLGVRLLVKGNLPEELLIQIQTLWDHSNAYQRSFSSLPLSPVIPFPTSPNGNLEKTFSPHAYLEIKPIGNGTSCPYIVKKVEKSKGDQITTQPIAIIKLRQTEVGSPRWQKIYNKEIPFPRLGCPPGSGAFIELLTGIYLRNLLKSIPELSHRCIIPRIAYAQMGHPSFSTKSIESKSAHPSSTLGTGIIEEFIPGCEPVSEDLLEQLNNPLLIELFAVLHTLILHNDGTIFNILLKDNSLVLIDNGYSLSQGGIDGGKFFWLKNPTLQKTPSPRIQEFIESIDENGLENLARQLHNELAQNASHAENFADEELSNLGMDRILPHKITLCFMKEAIKQNWSLSQIAQTLLYVSRAHHREQSAEQKNFSDTCLVNKIYKELMTVELPPENLKEKMKQLCLEAIHIESCK